MKLHSRPDSGKCLCNLIIKRMKIHLNSITAELALLLNENIFSLITFSDCDPQRFLAVVKLALFKTSVFSITNLAKRSSCS